MTCFEDAYDDLKEETDQTIREYQAELTQIALAFIESRLGWSGDFSFKRGSAANSVKAILHQIEMGVRDRICATKRRVWASRQEFTEKCGCGPVECERYLNR